MSDAGLPLVSSLDALQEQTDDQTFKVIIREVKNDISSGTPFSDSVKKYPVPLTTSSLRWSKQVKRVVSSPRFLPR